MKKILLITILAFLWTMGVHASEKKFLLCKDKLVIPEKMALTDFKNSFFPKDGEVLTITYYEKITKLWSEFSHMIQFTLLDYDESYKFQYPKDAIDGTIRSKYGLSIDKNSVHGSDSPENAKKEIDFFFNT